LLARHLFPLVRLVSYIFIKPLLRLIQVLSPIYEYLTSRGFGVADEESRLTLFSDSGACWRPVRASM